MNSFFLKISVASIALGIGAVAFGGVEAMNLVKNSRFEFHTFNPHRTGRSGNNSSGNVAFWNTERWGDISVNRESMAHDDVRPDYSAGNLVRIAPGRRFYQFFTLPDAELAHGDVLSFVVGGYQEEENALVASVKLMKLDSEDGTWSPSDYGLADKRTFPRYARGELVVHKAYEAVAPEKGRITLKIPSVVIEGEFEESKESSSKHINTVGVEVEFRNNGKRNVWVWSPCLTKGDGAQKGLPEARAMVPWYTYLPRTIQKLMKGETIHVLVMGTSIDRGSANPAIVAYDENPESETFKQPLNYSQTSRVLFDPDVVNRPDLSKYVGWHQHYDNFAGRLRNELMRKFDLGPDKICINLMAADGASVGEAFPALDEYCSLAATRPNPFANGGSMLAASWYEIHPELFERPEGPGPDLVIFGHGYNRSTDTPHEEAVYEGMIRYIQNRYPHTEFLFSLFQDGGRGAANHGDLQALSLRYGIPMLDYSKAGADILRWGNRWAYVPPDGHPQAAAHYIWFKEIEKAFEIWDPIMPGSPQVQLPERVHQNTYGWEGEIKTFKAGDPRLAGNLFVFEDTALNAWANFKGGSEAFVDGALIDRRAMTAASVRSGPGENYSSRHSSVSFGNLSLGDRHILELPADSVFNGVASHICPNRMFFGVEGKTWDCGRLRVRDFNSEFGAPYGNRQVTVPSGSSINISVFASDLSVAYVDDPAGGKMRVLVNGEERLVVPTDIPFKTQTEREIYMENRSGITGLGFGWHDVIVEAVDGPVRVLGLFAYDSRSNLSGERRIRGRASGGNEIHFSPAFYVRPAVICYGGLKCDIKDVTADSAKFSGGEGVFEIFGGGDRVRPVIELDWKPIPLKGEDPLAGMEWKEVFFDDFEREAIGGNYEVDSGEWKIEKGKLSTGTMEVPSIIFPRNVDFSGDFRLSVECRTIDSFAPRGACDMSFFSGIPEKPLDAGQGYFWMFGSRQNVVTGLKREGLPLVMLDNARVVPKKTHKMVLTRVGDLMTMSIDGKTVFHGRDMNPLASDPEKRSGAFYVYKSLADFDNLKVELPDL